MRVNKILKNVFSGSIYKITTIVIKFMLRAVLIKYLGTELVGLNTIISDWMSMLNLATLGIEIAIQYSLYQPIAQSNREQIEKIVRSAQIVYRRIGLIILCAGIGLMPAVPYLINDSIFSHIYIYGGYLLALLGVSASYLLCYKRIVLQAHEDVYIVNIVDIFGDLIFIGLEIILVKQTQSLYILLLLNSIKAVCIHGIVSVWCDKKYRIRKRKERDVLEERKMVDDLKDVAPLKIANYIYGYTDNVLISKFIGLTSVTIYSNYMIIANTVFGVSTMIVNATKSTFGIQLQTEGKKTLAKQNLERYIFLQYIFAAMCALSFYTIVDTFITLWVGNEFIIERTVLYVMCIEVFTRIIYQPLQMIFEATGKFKQDKKVTIISAILNIGISIILVNIFGLIGPVIGTLVTDIFIWFYRFKSIELDFFEQRFSRCIKKWIWYLISFILGFVLNVIWCHFLEKYMSGILFMFWGEIGTMFICLVIILIFFHKSSEFYFAIEKIRDLRRRG